MKKNLVTETILLTIAAFIAKAMGFVIRVYISNKIGAECMGMYSMVSSVYMLLATIATSGITISVSKLCAEEITKGNFFGAKRIVRFSCIVMGLIGFLAFIVLFSFSNYIGNVMLGDSRCILSLKLISLGLPFISISSCITGYFFACRKVIKPASSQVFEQFIKIISIYILFSFWLSKGLEFSLAAVVLSVTIADMATCFYHYILYKLERKKVINKDFSMKNTVKRLFSMSVPLAVNSYLNSGLRLVENLIIPFSLKKYGMTQSLSMAKYGMLKGMVMPVLIFPSVFLSSLANILVPTIASAKVKNDTKNLNKIICKILQLTLLIGIFLVGIFMSFSNDIGLLLYNSIECSQMLFSLSFVCPFLYLDMVVVAILNGLSQQMTSLRVNLLEAVLRICIIYFTMPKIGMNGFMIAIFTTSILSTFLYIRRLIKVTKIDFKFVQYVLKPTLCAAVVLLSTRFFYKTMTITINYPAVGLIIGIVISSIIYFVLIILLGCLNKNDFVFLFFSIKKKKATSSQK